MQRKVVLMPAVPGATGRPPAGRADLTYVKFARATWEWWCRRHRVDFVVMDALLPEPEYARMPITMQRWVAVARLLEQRGPDAQVALIDADTMVRWDTPDFFARSRGLSAVADRTSWWIFRSITAYQHLFPGTSLPWWEYFNCGLVVVTAEQRPLLERFIEFAVANWPLLSEVMEGGGLYGTDQTPLNFFVRRENEPVCLLPAPFNFLHCFPLEGELYELEARAEMEANGRADAHRFAQAIEAQLLALGFIDFTFVWHFSNVPALRALAMGEVWRRVRHNYPGVAIED